MALAASAAALLLASASADPQVFNQDGNLVIEVDGGKQITGSRVYGKTTGVQSILGKIAELKRRVAAMNEKVNDRAGILESIGRQELDVEWTNAGGAPKVIELGAFTVASTVDIQVSNSGWGLSSGHM